MWSTWSYIALLSISPKKLKEARDDRSFFHNVNPSLIIIPVTINIFFVHAIIDTGAAHALIIRSLLQTLLHPPVQTHYTTAAAILGDAHTTISFCNMVFLCMYINHIPTYASAFAVQSLGVDLVLGMDWCRTYNIALRIPHQELFLHHPQYDQTATHFQDTISIPIRLA